MSRSSISARWSSAAPALMKYQAWRSVYSMVSSYVKNEKLRQALSFHTLLVGGNPMTTSAIYALIHKLERDGGVWFAEGGTNRLVAGMVRHFERLGGVMRLGDPVAAIDTLGDRVTGVRTESGFELVVDAVASNADIVHSYRDLLKDSRSAQRTAAQPRAASASRLRCSSSISGCAAASRRSRTI